MQRINLVGVAVLILLGGLASGTARGQDLPPRKPGLWQIDMSMPGGQMPPQQMKMCIDATTDTEMFRLGQNASQGRCDKPSIVRSGSTVTVDTTCRMEQSKVTTHAVTQFTGDTAYHTEANTKIDPPIQGHAQSTVMQDAKWSGPCAADMQPGDVVMGNGMKMNMRQVLGGKQ